MRFSKTFIDHNRSTHENIIVRYEVLGGAKSSVKISRAAYDRLARKVGDYLRDAHAVIPSIKRMADTLTSGGCPCNLSKSLGLGNDANALYTIFRLWEDENLLTRDGNSRIFELDEGETIRQARGLFIEGANLIEIGDFDRKTWGLVA